MAHPTDVPLNELLRLDGRVAIVTGGAKGIGRGIVRRFVEAGASVVIADFDEAAAKAVEAEEISRRGTVRAVKADVGEKSAAAATVEAAVAAFGRCDVLVNNAGIYPFKAAMDMTADEWDHVQHVNLRGAFLFAQAAARQMIAQGSGGAIVNVGSIDSFHPSMVGLAAYDASKGGLRMFTKSFALEVASHGIRVNMVAPGGVQTEGVTSGWTTEQQAANVSHFASLIPMKRMGVPDDIAMVVLALSTPLAAYMTGAEVIVDGGRLLS